MRRKLTSTECSLVYSLYLKRLPMSRIAKILAHRIPGITSANVKTAVMRALRKIGLNTSIPRNGSRPISDSVKERRTRFCEEMIDKNEQFCDVVFFDETTIHIEQATGRLTRGGLSDEHVDSLHVWAGISCEGATPVIILNGKVRLASVSNSEPQHCKLIQEQYLPLARDLNEFKPISAIELAKGIRKFWNDNMSESQCRSHIGHIRALLRRVVSTNGNCVMDSDQG
ncbi:hypothetical protein OSTOST_26099 [Ostertagia ostertagi]